MIAGIASGQKKKIEMIEAVMLFETGAPGCDIENSFNQVVEPSLLVRGRNDGRVAAPIK
jgi:predicted DNA binding protein